MQPKVKLFCVGSNVRKNFNLGLSIEKRMVFSKWMLSLPIAYLSKRKNLCQLHREYRDHLLIHCEKTRVLWELLFALFRVFWVLPSSVRETLLGWHGLFVGKKRKKDWSVGTLCFIWTVWKVRNRIAFEDDMLSIQMLKSAFVCFLWLETKLFIDDC